VTEDRRYGPPDRRQTTFDAEGPGGIKVKMQGAGMVIGYLLGVVTTCAVWLWAVVK